jgi:hypothetical protein
VRAIEDGVLLFNVIWWGGPVASLVFFMMRPSETRRALAAVSTWTRGHQRVIVTSLFAGVGTYLTVRGAANLLG